MAEDEAQPMLDREDEGERKGKMARLMEIAGSWRLLVSSVVAGVTYEGKDVLVEG